jgi:hypothetical protein
MKPEMIWDRVNRGDGCWVWRGCTAKNGYGMARVSGRTQYAHRVAWEVTNGSIPEGLYICHKCDNRLCVRPDHLFLGSHADNMRDMASKGRSQHGEGHYNVKLSDETVRAIRQFVRSHGRGAQAAMAQQHGVARAYVSKLVNGLARRGVSACR